MANETVCVPVCAPNTAQAIPGELPPQFCPPPCPGGTVGGVDTETQVLCDIQADNTTVEFVRSTNYNTTDGSIAGTSDALLDGSPYTPTGTVADCNPYRLCEPLSDVNLNGDCGPGENVDHDVVTGEGVAPDSVITDDPTADPLCGGVWDRPSEASPFTVNESFRNATFDQPGPVLQGSAPYAGLTASPGWTGSNVDAPGEGWLQTSDINSFTNGIWQVPDPFSTADGMTARVTFASHDGTITPNGDGMAFVFTDGSIPPQSSQIGGGGGLGLANWEGGYIAVVMDEYGGVCGANSICITQCGANEGGTGGTVFASQSVAPHSFSADTGRANPGQLITSIITEGGQTYLSASVLWDGDSEPTVYYNRFNLTAAGNPVAPSTLRMSLYGGSGGAYRSEHEYRDAIATAAGKQEWRAFPIITDPIPPCVTSVRVEVCVDITFTEDTQTIGNGNPEAFLWLVNDATGAVLDRVQRSSQPSQVGVPATMCVDATVPVAQLPNLRFYVGAETRDNTGVYGSSWENLQITVAGLGCPVTPVRTLAISAPCPIDVRVIGGNSDGTPAPVTVVNTPATFEDALVCVTIGGVAQPAFRREVRAADGTNTFSFIGASGVPIVPDSWVPGACPIEDNEFDALILCDDVNGDRVIVVTTYSDVGLPTTTAYNLDGTPYAGSITDLVACGAGGEESDAVQMCDNGAVNFIRWFVKDAGEPTGVSFDTTLDGAPYTPTGPVTVGPCNELAPLAFVEGDEPGCANGIPWNRRRTGVFNSQTGALVALIETYVDSSGAQQPLAPSGFTLGACPAAEETCASTTSLLLCDSASESPTIVIGTATDTAVIPVDAQMPALAGGGAALWNGGTLTFPAEPGVNSINQTYRKVQALITAVPPSCDDGTVTITASVDVVNLGPNQGQQYSGRLRLFDGSMGILSSSPQLYNTPVNVPQTLTVSALVSTADLAAGTLRLSLDLETAQQTSRKTWEADNFVLEAAFGGVGCATTQFLRHVTVDCDGVTTSSFDTELDGVTPYTPSGAVGTCQDVTPPPVPAAECQDCEMLVLCDDNDGVFTSFLRTICRDCDGTVNVPIDTTLDGITPYQTTGVVGTCSPVATPNLTFVEGDEPGCADGVPWNRRRTGMYDTETGALVSVAVSYVDSDGNAQPNAPANFTLGACCCDQLLGESCWDNGTETGRAFIMYDSSTGTTTHLDQVTGDVVPSSQIITCAADLDPIDTVADIGRLEATAAGTVPANKQSVAITNVGTSAGSVLGVPLRPGETIQYAAYYDQVVKEMKRLPAIAYVGSATAILHISWVD